ncbi:MAG: ABC transporter permease [Actinophytocola sp.]|uniref:ABC transporter permease n=1 Tax=Actinophytocola sp. TaxID=1872138 RepID=UPI003C7945B4
MSVPTLESPAGTATPAGRRSRPGVPLVRGLLRLLAVLLLVTLAATALVDLIPGSPAAAILGPTATPDQVAALDAEYGFDRPFPTRYLDWLGSALTGDLGNSIQSRQPVLDTILARLPVTLEITLLALAISLLIAVPLAVYSGYRAGGRFDRFVSATSSALLAVPVFVAAVVLIYLLAVELRWFPVSGWSPLSEGLTDNLRHALLPAIALAVGELPAFLRLLRGDVATTMREDFVRTATARGLPPRYILFRHVLRPSSLSLVTVAGVALGRLLAGSIVVESLFALPGLGGLAIQSVPAKDIPTVQGLVVLVAVGYVLVNAAVDACYAVLDPRIRAR